MTLVRGQPRVVPNQPIGGANYEGEGRSELVADVGKIMRLNLVEFANALEQCLEIFVLLRYFALIGLFCGDVASFRHNEYDIPRFILYRDRPKIDNDSF